MVNEIKKLPEQDIIQLYLNDKMPIRKIANKFGVEKGLISKILYKNNCNKNKRGKIIPLTDEQNREIVKLYQEDRLSVEKIAIKLGYGVKRVELTLKRAGIARRPANARRYDVNDNFFEKIDSEDKAICLGLLYSDGYNCEENSKFYLTLCGEDIKTIEIFRTMISSNNPIYIYPRYHKDGRRKKDSAILGIFSPKLSADLSKIGCIQRKSLVKKFPVLDNINLERCFIYGYVMGNGGIYYNKGKDSWSAGFSSTLDVCLKTRQILSTLNINCCISKRKNCTTNFRSLSVEGNRQTKIFLDWLFKDQIRLMERKNKKYDAFSEYMRNRYSI